MRKGFFRSTKVKGNSLITENQKVQEVQVYLYIGGVITCANVCTKISSHFSGIIEQVSVKNHYICKRKRLQIFEKLHFINLNINNYEETIYLTFYVRIRCCC